MKHFLAVVVLSAAACSAEPRGFSWAVDSEGKPIPGSEQPMLTQDEVTEFRQQALNSQGVVGSGDCFDFRSAFPGEVVGFRGASQTLGCTWISAGLGSLMAAGICESNSQPLIKFWDTNQLLCANTRSWTSKPAFNNTKIGMYLSTTFDGQFLCEANGWPANTALNCTDGNQPSPVVRSVLMQRQ